MAVDVEARLLFDPAGIDVFCSAVYREGDGAYERDARHGGGDTCNNVRSDGIRSLDNGISIQMTGVKLTSKEPRQSLGAVCVLDAIQKASILIRLHACLDAVERESGEGREDAGCAGSDLDAVAFYERVGPFPLSISSPRMRHDGCCGATCDILVTTLDLRAHASGNWRPVTTRSDSGLV